MRQNGDAPKAIDGAAKKVEAVYSTPFLAHATMEPMNCTAKVTADQAEVWVPTQNAEAALAALSEESGLPLEKCEVYKHTLGGGFGRRGGAQDYVRQAVCDRQAVPRRAGQADLEPRRGHDARLLPADLAVPAGRRASTSAGKLVGLHVRVSGQSINAFCNPPAAKDGRDDRQLQGYYEKPATRSSATRCRTC